VLVSRNPKFGPIFELKNSGGAAALRRKRTGGGDVRMAADALSGRRDWVDP